MSSRFGWVVAALAAVSMMVAACSTRDDEEDVAGGADASLPGGGGTADAGGGDQSGGDGGTLSGGDGGPQSGADGGTQSGADGGAQSWRPSHCLLIGVAGGDSWLLREDGTDPVVLSNVTHAQYTADGRGILYGRGNAIHRMDSDGKNDRVQFSAGSGVRLYHPTESPDGQRLAYIHDELGQRQLRINDDLGQARTVDVKLTGETIEAIAWPRWSPKGDRIALWFETRDSKGDNLKRLLVVNPDGTNARIVTASQTDVEQGDWLPDGTRLVHETDDGAIGWTDVATQQTTSLIGSAGYSVDDPVVSADGHRILFRHNAPSGRSELRTARVSASGQVSDDVRLHEHTSELAPADWNPACR